MGWQWWQEQTAYIFQYFITTSPIFRKKNIIFWGSSTHRRAHKVVSLPPSPPHYSLNYIPQFSYQLQKDYLTYVRISVNNKQDFSGAQGVLESSIKGCASSPASWVAVVRSPGTVFTKKHYRDVSQHAFGALVSLMVPGGTW